MKVHVVIKPEYRKKDILPIIEQIKKVAILNNIDLKRYKRYGMFTVDVEIDHLDYIRKNPNIQSVTVDSKKDTQ